MQDLNQNEVWWSESTERFEQIAEMPCPYALRCLAKLERKEGFDALDSPLGIALKDRAELGIGAEAVTTTNGRKMIRGRKDGQWRGTWRRTAPRGVR